MNIEETTSVHRDLFIDKMHKHIEDAENNYRKGLFELSGEEAEKALQLWDNSQLLQNDHTARNLRSCALMMRYKASVASTKPQLNDLYRELSTQRSVRKKFETSYDAGSSIMERFMAVHTWFIPGRKARNRADDRKHDIVPALKVFATKQQMRNWIKRHIGI